MAQCESVDVELGDEGVPLGASCGVPLECLTFRSAQSAAAITSGPGALDITGLEPRNPFPLALGLHWI